MIDLKDFEYDELTEYLKSLGEPKFRTGQIFSWLSRGAESYGEMTDISKATREKLEKETYVSTLKIREKYVSKLDGTVKYLFELPDGNCIESVVMRYHHGLTICISSQVGCRMGCGFCASTLNGLRRNLAPHEITGQIIAAQKDLGERISNIVIMGIGEPLDNYDNVIKFLRNVNNPEGLGIGWRHITLSTCGLADKMLRFAEEGIPIGLAVSLHAPSDELRREMMPVARKYSISEILAACEVYFEKTGRRVSFEYALAENKNSSLGCARELVRLLKGRGCHVNLIPVNPVKERSYERGSRRSTAAFMDYLNKNGVNATLRRELGSDINASCGQLRNSEEA